MAGAKSAALCVCAVKIVSVWERKHVAAGTQRISGKAAAAARMCVVSIAYEFTFMHFCGELFCVAHTLCPKKCSRNTTTYRKVLERFHAPLHLA